MMEPPFISKPGLGVKALAIRERLSECTAGTGGLLAHAAQDRLAERLSPRQLIVRWRERDDARQVGVEPEALGAHYHHQPAQRRLALGDRVAVAGDAVVGGGQRDGAGEPTAPACRLYAGYGVVFGHARSEARGGLLDSSHSVVSHKLVLGDRRRIQQIAERGHLPPHPHTPPHRIIRPPTPLPPPPPPPP